MGQETSYHGKKHPPEVLANAIFDAIKNKRFEVIAPKFNPKLLPARLMRLVHPRIIRSSMKRIDPIPPKAIRTAQDLTKKQLKLGEKS